MIKLDSRFRHEYKLVGFNRSNAYLKSIHALQRYDKSILNDVFNILKVADAINSDFVECQTKIMKLLTAKANGIEDYDVLRHVKKDTMALFLLFMKQRAYEEIDKYIRSKRNIEFEVAADLYGDPVEDYYRNHNKLTKQKINKMKESGLAGYNVEKEPNISWDEHYFNISLQVSRNSKCFSRKIGAILVRDKRIISTGYNGPAEGQPTCDYRWTLDEEFKNKFLGEETVIDWPSLENKCPRQVIGFKSGEGTEWCPAVHAEENTVLNCARMGIEAKDTTMYMTCGIPCSKCMVKIINSGVKELVVTKFSWYDKTTKYILENSDVKVRLYDFVDKSDLYNFS